MIVLFPLIIAVLVIFGVAWKRVGAKEASIISGISAGAVGAIALVLILVDWLTR